MVVNGINAKNVFFSANEKSEGEGKGKEEEGKGERERDIGSEALACKVLKCNLRLQVVLESRGL